MSKTVWLMANMIDYPQGGGLFWLYLNWALGLRAAECRVIWIEAPLKSRDPERVGEKLALLKARLDRYDAVDAIAVTARSGERLPFELTDTVDLNDTPEADLLLNFSYRPMPCRDRVRRSVFVDIDPALAQIWLSEGQLVVGDHDLYYTIGETIGTSSALVPDCGVEWHYTPMPVFMDEWTVASPGRDAAFTTVTHWGQHELTWQGRTIPNGKRDGFKPFLDLPRFTSQPLELAVCLDDEPAERTALQNAGWRISDPHSVAGTPWEYRDYVRGSLGEFSCAKPSCMLTQNAWISERSLCYLASGKPCVVQHTGPSRFLPDAEGLFRFRDIDEARSALATVADNYDRHAKAARAIAEEYFDARTVVGRVLERACP